jgi:hypothetical protein
MRRDGSKLWIYATTADCQKLSGLCYRGYDSCAKSKPPCTHKSEQVLRLHLLRLTHKYGAVPASFHSAHLHHTRFPSIDTPALRLLPTNMPLYIINVGKIAANRNESANKSFATALASLHAKTFHTNPSLVRVEFRCLDFDYHGRFVSYPKVFFSSQLRSSCCANIGNKGRSRFPVADNLLQESSNARLHDRKRRFPLSTGDLAGFLQTGC